MSLFNILDKPRDSDIHTLADFAEILCLTDLDGESGTEAVHDQIFDNSGKKLSEETLQSLMSHLSWRKEAFGKFYPFNIHKNNFDLESELSRKHKLYFNLLMCANLPFLDRSLHKEFTDTFEIIAQKAFRELWSPLGEVTSFGKNNSAYTGTKPERLNKLFSDIGNRGHFSPDFFRASDSGDGGIDLAAWIQLDKYQPTHFFSALAQCACSRTEWTNKQFEIKLDRFMSHAQITNKWSEILFTPLCFRGNNGEWAVSAEVSNGILFDRLRIINLLENNIVPLSESIKDLMEEKRDLTT